MRQDQHSIAALSRSLAMLEAILTDREGRGVAAIAAELGLPRATAYRQVASFVHEGFLRRLPNGRLVAGPRLLALGQVIDPRQVIVAAAAPVLHRLAARLGCVVQLGTLDNDMVTYRIKTGRGAGDFFTRVGLQLEAYCTGIGKVLLAHLPERDRQAYLDTGPFPALTAKTITDPAQLRATLEVVRRDDFARDDEEIAEGLACLAVPIRSADGTVAAAISASRSTAVAHRRSEAEMLAALHEAAAQIEAVIAAG